MYCNSNYYPNNSGSYPLFVDSNFNDETFDFLNSDNNGYTIGFNDVSVFSGLLLNNEDVFSWYASSDNDTYDFNYYYRDIYYENVGIQIVYVVRTLKSDGSYDGEYYFLYVVPQRYTNCCITSCCDSSIILLNSSDVPPSF